MRLGGRVWGLALRGFKCFRLFFEGWEGVWGIQGVQFFFFFWVVRRWVLGGRGGCLFFWLRGGFVFLGWAWVCFFFGEGEGFFLCFLFVSLGEEEEGVVFLGFWEGFRWRMFQEGQWFSGVLLKSTRFLIWSKSFIAISNWV